VVADVGLVVVVVVELTVPVMVVEVIQKRVVVVVVVVVLVVVVGGVVPAAVVVSRLVVVDVALVVVVVVRAVVVAVVLARVTVNMVKMVKMVVVSLRVRAVDASIGFVVGVRGAVGCFFALNVFAVALVVWTFAVVLDLAGIFVPIPDRVVVFAEVVICFVFGTSAVAVALVVLDAEVTGFLAVKVAPVAVGIGEAGEVV